VSALSSPNKKCINIFGVAASYDEALIRAKSTQAYIHARHQAKLEEPAPALPKPKLSKGLANHLKSLYVAAVKSFEDKLKEKDLEIVTLKGLMEKKDEQILSLQKQLEEQELSEDWKNFFQYPLNEGAEGS
jgi:hypothetical protein